MTCNAVYYSKAGLWKGEPFELCSGEMGVCKGPGLYAGSRVATLNKYGAARTGRMLLEVARPEALKGS